MTNTFTHYSEPVSVVADGMRRIEVSLGEIGGLDLGYIGVENNGSRVDTVLTLPEVRHLTAVLHDIDPEHQPTTGGYYLYRVVITEYPEGSRNSEIINGEEYSWSNENWQPEGWNPDEVWVAQHGDRFFWPSTKREYRSKPSAKARARLIESYGATAVVIRSSLITWPEPDDEESTA